MTVSWQRRTRRASHPVALVAALSVAAGLVPGPAGAEEPPAPAPVASVSPAAEATAAEATVQVGRPVDLRITRDPEAPHVRPRYKLAAFETFAELAIGVGWYWANTDLNAEDWDLRWDWPSWRGKLVTFEHVRFDTNGFGINAIRHPFAGAMQYQVGRANGLGVLGGAITNFVATVLWEWVVEFKEMPSLNDVIVNMATGFSIGEPLFQIGEISHASDATWLDRGLALVVSPFDAIHDWVQGGSWLSPDPRPWHRAQVGAGLHGARFDGEGGRGEVAVSLDAELSRPKTYARAGAGVTTTSVGAWSRLRGEWAFGPGEPEAITRRFFHSETTFVGQYRRALRVEGDGLHGWGLFLGLGSSFDFETRQLAEELDRVSTCGLLGPRLELELRAGPRVLTWNLAVDPDFAMVQAHVFGPSPTLHPVDGHAGVLPVQGYYFGAGVTLVSRLRLAEVPFFADLEVVGQQFWSLDGRDRRELGGGPDDPHGVTDQRLSLSLAVGVQPFATGTTIRSQLALRSRQGAWADLERRTSEVDVGLVVEQRF